MDGGTSPRGYTIVEVMVFLAISGVMFLLAVAFVSGRQSKAEFQQGMNDINTQVEQVINNVADGLTASNGTFSCSASISGVYSFGTGTTTGSNTGCVLLGKVMQFDVANASGPVLSSYNIYTVAGRQFKPNSTNDVYNLATNFADAEPLAMAPGSSSSPPSSDDLTQYDSLTWGLQVTKMTNDGTAINGVGFFSNFGGFSTSGGGQQSGSQTIQVIPITGPLTSTGETEQQFIGQSDGVDSSDTYTHVDPTPDIVICFSGSPGEYGELTIGDGSNGQGQRLTTNIQISNSQMASCM
jgi:type II secretory pathway pseudopilin PulG